MKNSKFVKICYISFFLFILSNFSAVTLINQPPTREAQKKQPFISSSDSARSIKALTRDIIKILANKNLDGSRYSIAVYSIDNKKYLFQKDVSESLIPASTSKFFTSFAALAAMGPDFPVKTSVYTDADKISGGVIDGNIYVVGHGDALLSITDVEFLADQIRKSGITEIKGNVYADGSYYDEETERIVYSGDKDIVQATQPITALSLESNIATVLVSSGSKAARNVSVQVIPSSDAFKVTIKTPTRGLPPGRNVRRRPGTSSNDVPASGFNSYSFMVPKSKPVKAQKFGDSPSALAYNGSRNSDDFSVATELQTDGFQNFIVSGRVEQNSTKSYRHYMLNPGLVVAGALKNRLMTGGIKIDGQIAQKRLEARNPRLLAEFGRPLIEILYPMNKNSDNYLAENVFKMIGAHSGRYKSNSRDAREVMKNVFDSLGARGASLVFNDGSGLSRRNQVTTDALVRLLASATRQPFGRMLDSTLPVAGFDGTLRNRMVGSPAENNLHAKTGTHGNVSALAGYVTTLDGERLAFTFMFNGPSVGAYKSVEDELGVLLSQFFYFNEEK